MVEYESVDEDGFPILVTKALVTENCGAVVPNSWIIESNTLTAYEYSDSSSLINNDEQLLNDGFVAELEETEAA